MSNISQPFWDGLKNGIFQLQQCDACHEFIFFPRAYCTACQHDQLTWKKVSGEGEVYSFTIARTPTDPRFIDDLPYAIALVTLQEGPRMVSNIIGCDVDEVTIGMKVTAQITQGKDEQPIVCFVPQ